MMSQPALGHPGSAAQESTTPLAIPDADSRLQITRRLTAWWILAVGFVVSFAFFATNHMWRATGTLSATLALCTVLRAVLPVESAGGLVVRRRLFDVITLAGFAIAVAVSGFTLDLTALH